MEIKSAQKDKAASEYILLHNETELKIHVDAASGTVKTDVRRHFLAPRIPGTVTELYQEAARVMQAEATERDTPLRYVLATRNKKMKAWATSPDKGRGIFNWEKLEDNNDTLVGETTIFPKPQ